MTRKIELIPERYAQAYKPNPDLQPGVQLAQFLLKAAKDMPQEFFQKTVLARIAFNMSKTPQPTHEYVKKRFGYVLKSAETILERDHNCTVYSDRVEGYRATTNDSDRAKTKLRAQSARLVTHHQRVQKTANAIDIKNLHGAIRDEVLNAKHALNRIGASLVNLPQLPAKPEEKKV